MQTVYLNGDIAKFGAVWNTNCSNIRDIFRLIECQTPGFRKYLIDASEAGVNYEIKRGEDFLETPDELFLSLNDEDIIITEVPSGSGGNAQQKLLTAIAITIGLLRPELIPGLATVLEFGYGKITVGAILGSIATNLALTSISELLAPGPEVDSAEENKGYLFGGPVNAVAQGMPVPLAYGELIVGGSPISVNYDTRPVVFGTYTNDSSDDHKLPRNHDIGGAIPPPDAPPSTPGDDSDSPLDDIDISDPVETPQEVPTHKR